MHLWAEQVLFQQSKKESKYDCERAFGIKPTELKASLDELKQYCNTDIQVQTISEAEIIFNQFSENKKSQGCSLKNFFEFIQTIQKKLKTPVEFSPMQEVRINSLLMRLKNEYSNLKLQASSKKENKTATAEPTITEHLTLDLRSNNR